MAIGIGTLALHGLNAYGNISAYKSEREQGKSVVGAGAKLLAETALFAAVPSLGVASLGAMVIGGGMSVGMGYAQGTGRENAQAINNVYRGTMGGNFVDTETAQTMRQRGLEAISHSGNNLNQVFGNEARTFYRGMR